MGLANDEGVSSGLCQTESNAAADRTAAFSVVAPLRMCLECYLTSLEQSKDGHCRLQPLLQTDEVVESKEFQP
jgi:hypothetical protein